MKREDVTKQNLKFKPKIYKNLNPTGHWSNIVFGLCEAVDCIVRVVTLGRYATNLTTEQSRIMTVRHFTKLKQNRQHAQKE